MNSDDQLTSGEHAPLRMGARAVCDENFGWAAWSTFLLSFAWARWSTVLLCPVVWSAYECSCPDAVRVVVALARSTARRMG